MAGLNWDDLGLPKDPKQLEAELDRERVLRFGPDASRGLHPDFSDQAVRRRVLGNVSGLPPHERPGHYAPNPSTAREESAKAGIEAIRRFDLDDGIDHT